MENNNQLPKLLPINIILVSYNRVNFLKKTIQEINFRTRYPYKIFVVDNNSTDGSIEYLKHSKVVGDIFDHLFLPENKGQSIALNAGFHWMQGWEVRRKSDDLFLVSNDDIIPPLFEKGFCWLEYQKHLFEKFEESHVVGAISHRIERTQRVDVDETEELIRLMKTSPSVFKMLRRSDFAKLGESPFLTLNHWDSNSAGTVMRTILKKRFYMATKIYSSHFSYMVENKGYDSNDKSFLTYPGEAKLNLYKEKPYCTIDPKSNIPIKINSNADFHEHQKRLEYWGKETGVQSDRETESVTKVTQRGILAEYCKEGKCIDLGCGKMKCHPNCIGVDSYPYPCVDIIHDVSDLWFFKDGEIDTIVASHVLEHLADTKKVLQEWNRVLKVGGIMAFIVPDGTTRPNSIREPSHKVVLTIPVIAQIMYKLMGYKVLRLEVIPNLPKKNIICVARKR